MHARIYTDTQQPSERASSQQCMHAVIGLHAMFERVRVRVDHHARQAWLDGLAWLAGKSERSEADSFVLGGR